MSIERYYNQSRLVWLLKLEARRNRKAFGMALGIIIGFMFFIGLILSPVLDPAMTVFEHYSGYGFSLLGGGFVLSSLAFRDLGNALRRYNYLMLPATSLEKFLSMWLLTSLGWILGFTLLYSIYTLLANFTGRLIFEDLIFVGFNPIAGQTLKFVKLYFILQGIFLAGAAHFRGYPFPKTLLLLVVTGIITGLTGYLITRGVYDPDIMSNPDLFKGLRTESVWKVLQFLFRWVLAPLSWLIAWFGIKEQEV